MEIRYKTKKLERQLTDPEEMAKSFGRISHKLNLRLQQLFYANNLAVLRTIPAARCHELVGQRKGEFAVHVSNNYRLIFEPYHDQIPKKNDGGIEWAEVTAIQIIGIEDYH